MGLIGGQAYCRSGPCRLEPRALIPFVINYFHTYLETDQPVAPRARIITKLALAFGTKQRPHNFIAGQTCTNINVGGRQVVASSDRQGKSRSRWD